MDGACSPQGSSCAGVAQATRRDARTTRGAVLGRLARVGLVGGRDAGLAYTRLVLAVEQSDEVAQAGVPVGEFLKLFAYRGSQPRSQRWLAPRVQLSCFTSRAVPPLGIT